MVAAKKAVMTARRKADERGLGPNDILEGRVRQTIAATTKSSVGDTGLADAARQASLDDARRRMQDMREGRAPYPEPTGVMSNVERPRILGPGPMKRGSTPGAAPMAPAAAEESMGAMETASDSMDALAGLMGSTGIGKGRRRSKKKTKKGGKKKKGGRKTRRRA